MSVCRGIDDDEGVCAADDFRARASETPFGEPMGPMARVGLLFGR